MKPLQRVCCLSILTLAVTACGTVPRVEESLNRLDLGSETYVVRAGDTLESVAFRYKLSPNELAALNPNVGRYFSTGTHINIRSASRATQNYQSKSAWAVPEEKPDVQIPRQDEAVVSRAETPKAVPERRYEQEPNRSVFTPGVSAVVSDVNLLSPRKAYRRDDLPAREAEYMQQRDPQPGYAPREVVEEEYTGGQDSAGSSAVVSEQLQSLVGRWTWPTEGQVARGFSPIQEGRHGVDIAGIPGQPVVAVKDGTVAYSGKDPSGAGNLIIVRHEDSLLTAYSHARDLYVAENDTVRAGDPIGTLGWNAQQESVLRFEVRQNGNSLNPMDFLSVR
ncbi:peptidoglycan DD-metalloendopeptidase family protein [Granulosicoccus antarcticus]|uniref:Murein hydrolase activator NlpD n=1 Tax=Granulosicoccus antarcticus IMCC3135 TaxID=1192854 RepID=A0A2Z2NV72_9GAMM|nr:peptidoglycan DD-metalloendopeptidase family protein [Granulosicoccus antarcticus]ASJ75143.1 Murein hydrolase activator NlpD [Granulosicoccus antarcticus IMCC3135]